MRSLAVFLPCFCLALACQSVSYKYEKPVAAGAWLKGISIPYAGPEGEFFVSAQIYFPDGYKKAEPLRTIILLPPRGRGIAEWEHSSIAKKFANQYHLALVCPDTGKSVYETSFFPESKDKWEPVPAGKWIAEILVPYMREQFALCPSGEATGIVGVETGARGALLLAAKYPGLFSFAGGFSGPYDITVLNSSAYASIYGPKKAFQDRWTKEDNIITLSPALKNSFVYIVHGKRDDEVQIDHSQLVAMRLGQLRKLNPQKYNYRYIERNKTHGWDFWNTELAELFKTIDQTLKK
jgi:enterochelin esterase-like enzyme